MTKDRLFHLYRVLPLKHLLMIIFVMGQEIEINYTS